MRSHAAAALAALAVVSATSSPRPSQAAIDPALFSAWTWRPIGPHRAGRATAIAGDPDRPAVFFMATPAGLWTTDDYGQTWAPVFDDQPALEIQALAVHTGKVFVRSPAGVSASTDDGRSWFTPGPDALVEAERALSGVGDPRRWVNPGRPDIIGVADERGASISVNGGRTWSTRLNQPTGAFDHAVVDGSFPYRVCGPQQGLGAICVASRTASGHIGLRDTLPLPLGDTTWVAAGRFGESVEFFGGLPLTRLTAESRLPRRIDPLENDRSGEAPVAPLLVAPMEPGVVFAGLTNLWRTADRGETWTRVGGPFASGSAPPAIMAVEPSPVDRQVIWLSTTDGHLHLTPDGGRTWRDVTPQGIVSPGSIRRIEGSHFDRNTAYVAVIAGAGPRLLRTRDGGETWVSIADGLGSEPVLTVREDPMRRGLLFAGGLGVHLSFDDGESWLPIRRNMPRVAVTELVVRGGDLVASTDGRGFWVLDDITPFRQITADVASADVFLFRPQNASRFRTVDQPVQGPAPANPPDGVAVSYLLGKASQGPATIEVIEPVTGDLVRREVLASGPGLHRWYWDVRHPAPPVPELRRGGFVTPGTYQVRLTVGTRVLRQAITVHPDPRVPASATDYSAQHAMLRTLSDAMGQVTGALDEIRRAAPGGQSSDARRTALESALRPLPDLFRRVESSDAAPSAALARAVEAALERVREALLLGGRRPGAHAPN